MKQKYAVLIIIALLIIGGLIYWFKHIPTKIAQAPSGTKSAINQRQPVAETQIDKSHLPPGFPSDIPLEADATVTQNYTATNAAGMFQSSRDFISGTSTQANYQLYLTALPKAGWTITGRMADATTSQDTIMAVQGPNNLNIRIYNNNSQVIVSLNNETKP